MLDAEYINEYYRTMGMVMRQKRLVHYNNMEDFARDIGMKFQQYSKCELGRNIKMKTLLRILEGLNVNHGEFFAEVHIHMNNWKKKTEKKINNYKPINN